MARRKNYYASNNKKYKEGSKVLTAFVMLIIAASIAILKMLVEVFKWGYTSYKNRQR